MNSPETHQLLNLAAKAAGYQKIKYEYTTNEPMTYISREVFDHCEGRYRTTTGLEKWNPLTDDGDALRLAVKLGIKVMPHPVMCKEKHSVIASRRWFEGEDNDGPIYGGVEVVEVYRGDPNAATRRAIVRAAAEIGRAMP